MKKILRISRIVMFLTALLGTATIGYTQVAGDEDQEMFNRAKTRDRQAIDEAVKGWWTKSMETHERRIKWWRDAQFGMFIHWGVYALPGGEWKGKEVHGYAEHLMRKEKITRQEYLGLAQRFNPTEFDAEEWVLTAKNTGMRYFIVTAKHHDGFAMYDSEISDFDIIDQTPFRSDPMAELAAACRKHDMKFGFYYSHAFDWEHPDAPGNDWEYSNPGGDLHLYGGRNWYDAHPELLPKAIRYLDEKSIPQIKELIHKYHPDILWFDTPHKIPLSENIRILKEIRAADPDIVVNGRLARTGSISFGDYKNTSDRPAEFYPVEGDWEAIPTTNESYGYNRHDRSHKPAGFFIQLLAKSTSRDGNLLMNIGPMGNGMFDPKDLEILKVIGEWIAENGESIYKTNKSPLPLQSWGVTTRKGDKLYLHVFEWPTDGKLVVGGIKSDLKKACLLADAKGKSLKVERINPSDISINVPSYAPDTNNTVIVLETIGEIQANPVRVIDPHSKNNLLAFDAELYGGDFGFGDGKAKRHFVNNWKSKDQRVGWKFRLNEPATYKIVVKYAAAEKCAGTYLLKVGTFTKQDTIPEEQESDEVYAKESGIVSFKAGIHNLEIEPLEIEGEELMQLLEIELIPVNNKITNNN